MTESQREVVHHLWDSLADIPRAKPDRAPGHLMARIAGMIGASNAYWLSYLRLPAMPGDPLKGLKRHHKHSAPKTTLRLLPSATPEAAVPEVEDED